MFLAVRIDANLIPVYHISATIRYWTESGKTRNSDLKKMWKCDNMFILQNSKTIACILTAKQTQVDLRNGSNSLNARYFSAR